MIVLLTLTTAGTDAGPFNLYSDADGYLSAFETGVSRAALLAGYTSLLVPNDATIVRISSAGLCTNYVDIAISGLITTTTTSTTTSIIPPTYILNNLAIPNGVMCTACAAPSYPISMYTNPSYVSPVIGMQCYSSPALTTPFAGAGQWFKVNWNGGIVTYTVLQINSLGIVIGVGTCLTDCP